MTYHMAFGEHVLVRSLVLVCTFLFSLWILPFLYGLILSPTRNVPGPLLARVTRWYEYYLVRRGDSNQEFMRLHQKYGPVVRIGPNRFSFSEPADIRIIYDKKVVKTDFYKVIMSPDPDKQNVFTVLDPIRHRERRKKLSNLYSMSTMVSYEGAVNRMGVICQKKLTQFAKENRVVSLPQFMQWYAFDVIGEITFDTSFSMMENEGDASGMAKNIREANDYLAYTGLVPELHNWLIRLQKLMGRSVGADLFEKWAEDQMSKHQESNVKETSTTNSNSFLAKLVALHKEGRVEKCNILDACGSNVGAGSDTTAISISAAIWHLYSNPDKLAKLRNEIDSMAEKDIISDPITFQEANAMPYLQAVIKESLRLHPAVGSILPRKVPKGGWVLSEAFFPEGTHVGANPWVVHHNKGIYGDDADVYRPERWLEPKSGEDLRDSMNMTFGAGSRTCLGKNISLLELTKILPQIVRNFDFTFDHDCKPITECTWFVYLEYKVEVKLRVRS